MPLGRRDTNSALLLFEALIPSYSCFIPTLVDQSISLFVEGKIRTSQSTQAATELINYQTYQKTTETLDLWIFV